MRELEIATKLTGHAWQCSSVNFHPAGNVVASASWDRTVRYDNRNTTCYQMMPLSLWSLAVQ